MVPASHTSPLSRAAPARERKMDGSRHRRGSDGSPFPRRWWQWFLVYPTVGLALIGYLPTLVERVSAALQQGSLPSLFSGNEDLRQYKIFSRNQACWTAPDPEFKTIEVKGYQVGVTP